MIGWCCRRLAHCDAWRLNVPMRLSRRIGIEKPPDKTYIGRVDHGFDFLGYQFDQNARTGLIIADKTLNNHQDSLRELAAHGADAEQIANYKKPWWRWVNCGVDLRDDERVLINRK